MLNTVCLQYLKVIIALLNAISSNKFLMALEKLVPNLTYDDDDERYEKKWIHLYQQSIIQFGYCMKRDPQTDIHTSTKEEKIEIQCNLCNSTGAAIKIRAENCNNIHTKWLQIKFIHIFLEHSNHSLMKQRQHPSTNTGAHTLLHTQLQIDQPMQKVISKICDKSI